MCCCLGGRLLNLAINHQFTAGVPQMGVAMPWGVATSSQGCWQEASQPSLLATWSQCHTADRGAEALFRVPRVILLGFVGLPTHPSSPLWCPFLGSFAITKLRSKCQIRHHIALHHIIGIYLWFCKEQDVVRLTGLVSPGLQTEICSVALYPYVFNTLFCMAVNLHFFVPWNILDDEPAYWGPAGPGCFGSWGKAHASSLKFLKSTPSVFCLAHASKGIYAILMSLLERKRTGVQECTVF